LFQVKDKENSWESFLKSGYLTWDDRTDRVEIEWDPFDPEEIKSSLATGGRGMELSELSVFNGNLYSVDDRTGVVYKLIRDRKSKWKVIPWVILADGNGEETKGFKCEWMAVKDEHLYVGGLGKEWTTQDGTVLNFNPMFVKRISQDGQVEHIDWHERYLGLRTAAGIDFPGYMVHEAATWSDHHKEWTFLPRRASKLKYNDVEDERHGTNMMLTTNDNFFNIKLTHVGDLDHPSHGFSSFKFVPDTKDSVIVALKSEELQGKVATYIMVFKKSDGKILYPETYIGDHKYEGIEFI
jgi:soluble calcium-activated nucleotidase 1